MVKKAKKRCIACGCEIIKNSKTGYCYKCRPRSGKDNPMYGRSVYDVWLSKYGKKEADRRQAEMIVKITPISQDDLTTHHHRRSV